MKNIYISKREIEEKKKLITIFSIIYTVCLLVIIFVIATSMTYDKVYAGVTLNGKDLSGMTREDVFNMINNNHNKALEQYKIYFLSNNGKEELGRISLKDIPVKYNAEAIAESVYNLGREGSFFERLSDITKLTRNNIDISLYSIENITSFIQYDEIALNIKLTEIISEYSSEMIPHIINKEDDKLVILSGKPGRNVDKERLKKKILEELLFTEDVYIDLDEYSEITVPDKLNAKEIYSQYNISVKNASYIRREGNIEIQKETKGESVKIEELEYVCRQAENIFDTRFEVDITVVEPEIKAGDLYKPEFNEVIGKADTGNLGVSDRRKNIELAASFINGKILLPGETFSFNDDKNVGDTTKEKGYKPGATYVGDKIEYTYGGGVCQVSTTLYLACIDAGLEIVERYPHSRPVGYAKKGLDAAIFYGTKDFVFKNNLSVPIELCGYVENGKIIFQIKGINLNKNIKYTFRTEKIDSYNQSGKEYEVYMTYRTIIKDGVAGTEKQFGNKSRYWIK